MKRKPSKKDDEQPETAPKNDRAEGAETSETAQVSKRRRAAQKPATGAPGEATAPKARRPRRRTPRPAETASAEAPPTDRPHPAPPEPEPPAAPAQHVPVASSEPGPHAAPARLTGPPVALPEENPEGATEEEPLIGEPPAEPVWAEESAPVIEPPAEEAAVESPADAPAVEPPAPKPPARPSQRFEEHIVEPEDALPQVALEDLSEMMRQAATRAHWTHLMPVQAKAIPYMLAGRDLMIQSRTGSGKTGAFVLPILQRIDPSRNACQALILVPTRELALQVTNEAQLLAGRNGPRTVPVYGGVGYNAQIDGFRKGAHIVVGTPGRVLDHLLKRTLSLDRLDILVFDEADRMLSMGFYPDMKHVQRYLPRGRRISGYMFSATLPAPILRLAREFLHKPEFLSLSRDRVHVAETEHVYYSVPPMDKDRCLVRVIEVENPTSAIVFCNTKQRVHFVTVVLQRFGYDADELSADLAQAARESVMARARAGQLRFLVATDVAARGIDIPDLSHVIIYETPEDPEAYIHRAGRTGRAGAAGVAISLVADLEEMELKRIGRRFNIDFEKRPLPTDEDVRAVVSERVIALLEARLRGRDRLQVERMQRFLPLGRTLSQSEDEIAVIAMLLDDFYQQTLHAPPPLPTGPAAPIETVRPTGESGGHRRRQRRRR